MVPSLRISSGFSTTIRLADVVQGTPPRYATEVEVGRVGSVLVIRFTCEDSHIWSTMTERDQPLWEEEVVEVFLAPGAEEPRVYFEFEVNPEGTLWDGIIQCPTGGREGLVSGWEWNCEGLVWSAWKDEEQGRWGAELSIPLDVLAPEGIPSQWRFNACRVERPLEGGAEFTAWSPTGGDHAEFHRPSKFGILNFV